MNNWFTPFDKRTLTRLRSVLARWFSRNGRLLPWRQTGDPYHIWISEIMLQQTTVTAVIPYFERFLARFPDLSQLAAASEPEVLRYWEGLGYYSRGRNLLKAAAILLRDHQGQFPVDSKRLSQLPGIGRYTAGAIASFAFDQPAPIVEANTRRLYCRLLGFDGDPMRSEGEQLLWTFAEHLLPRKGSGTLNQSLMELGARVCTPVQPACGSCPLQFCCQAFLTNRQHEIPRRKSRPTVTPVVEACILIQQAGKVLLRECQPGERWAGLWDFPRVELLHVPFEGSLKPSQIATARREIQSLVAKKWDLCVTVDNLIREIRHSVTRYRIRLLGFAGQMEATSAQFLHHCEWVTPESLESYPLSKTGRQLARAVSIATPEKTLP